MLARGEMTPQHRSKRTYEISPEESQAIIHATAYHRRDFDLAVIWFSPHTHASTIQSPVPIFSEPTAAFGELDRLPFELISKICLDLDLASFFRLRQVNARGRQVLGALREYQIATTHALNPLRALLRTRSASGITLQDFCRLLYTQRCSLCETRYGDLVSLPTWIRCCSRCLRNGAPGTCVTSIASVKRTLKLSRRSLEQLSRLTTLPGTYTMGERRQSKRKTVVSTLSALSAYRKEHAGEKASNAMIKQLIPQPALAFMACCAFPSLDVRTNQIQNGVSCAGCELATEDSIATHLRKQTCDWRDTVYSHEEFLEHFVWCEQAQLLWGESNHGTTQSPKFPSSCQKGGYFKHRE